jgi:putative DNA primase/helicase
MPIERTAARSIGSKTFLALAIGLAVAGATSLLRWSAPKARRVLCVDGEMTLIDLQRRVAALKAGMGVDIRNDHFRLLAADHTDVPDLGTEAGQQALDPLLDGVDLLIVDNISPLCWAGSDNSAGSWTSMQEWILRLRKRGLAVLLVHHSGKSGEQRGTSRREDVLDTVIGLRRPEDYEPQQGARFEVHVEKRRGHFGDAGRPFEARLVSTPDGSGLTWSARDLKPSHLEEAAALFRSGVTVRAVAAQLGVARSSAGRLRQKALEDGLLDSDDGSEAGGSEDESGTLH